MESHKAGFPPFPHSLEIPQRRADDIPAHHPAEQGIERPRAGPGSLGPGPVLHQRSEGRERPLHDQRESGDDHESSNVA